MTADLGPFTRGQLRSKWLRTPTDRQLKVLAFIRDYIEFHKYAPTVREIGAAFNIASTQGAQDHIRALLRKGLVTKNKGQSRTLVITVDGASALAGSFFVNECGVSTRDLKPAAEPRCADEQEGR